VVHTPDAVQVGEPGRGKFAAPALTCEDDLVYEELTGG
jgi:hypothetical protein